MAEGQTITTSGSGTLGFLVSASYGPASGTGTITYTDGSTQSYTLTHRTGSRPRRRAAGPWPSARRTRTGRATPPTPHSGDIFSETVALTAGKTVASVTLPPGGALTSGNRGPPRLRHRHQRRRHHHEGPYGGTAAAMPGTVQAANYDTGGQGVAYNVTSTNGTANSYRPDGVDLEACTDTGCGYDIGWTAAGQWFKYTVNVATAGTYTVSVRLASPSGVTDALHIASSSGANLSGNGQRPGDRRLADLGHGHGQRHPPRGPADADHRPGQRRLEPLLHGLRRRRRLDNEPGAEQARHRQQQLPGLRPSNVTDGNTSTYWESTDGARYPQTITVNLGSVQSIGSITLDLPPSSSWSARTETLSVLDSHQ